MDVKRYKAPRTRHLPSSRTLGDDDKVASLQEVAAGLVGRRVVVTEKMDGENSTIYADGHSHARSIDSRFHPSRSVVREIAGRIGHLLPPTYRVCGENVYALHSIAYEDLSAYFQVFAIWDDERCLSWEETVEWCDLLDLVTVPVIYEGPWIGEAHAHQKWREYSAGLERESEGFVVRRARSFELSETPNALFKWVRPNHVQTGTSTHWMNSEVKPNSLAPQGQ